MNKIKCITIYPEVYHNENLTPNEKIYLSVVRYFTLEGKTRCCRLSDQEMSEELLIDINQIRKIKCKLKKLGLISVDGKEIKYKKTLPNSNETLPNSNQNPCNSNENQQVAEGNKYNKYNKKNNKEKNKEKNKDNNVADRKKSDDSMDDFLSSWEEGVLKEKEEYLKKEKNNSCSVVDMVTGLPTKEETPTKEEPVKEQPIDRSSIVNKMIDLIDYWIKTEIVDTNMSKSEKDRLLKENSYNRMQLQKHLTEYIENKDQLKLITNKQYFENITQNAFKSYKNKVHSEVKTVSNRNPYSDLEDSNTYRETDRWMK